jgi:predicted HicB family RNase H-like nuclease
MHKGGPLCDFYLAAGVVLGMIFAPAPGSETREQLAERAREWLEVSAEKAAETSKEKAGDLGARVGRKLAEAAVEAAAQDLRARKRKRV